MAVSQAERVTSFVPHKFSPDASIAVRMPAVRPDPDPDVGALEIRAREREA